MEPRTKKMFRFPTRDVQKWELWCNQNNVSLHGLITAAVNTKIGGHNGGMVQESSLIREMAMSENTSPTTPPKLLILMLAVVAGISLYLVWASWEQKRLLRLVAENIVLQNELDERKLQLGPCVDKGADVRTWEARRQERDR